MSTALVLWGIEAALAVLLVLAARRLPRCTAVLVALVAVAVGGLEVLRGSSRHWAPLTYDSAAVLGRSSMRAAVYTVGVDVGWKVSTVPVPHHSDLSMLVRVRAAALNPSNFKHPMILAAWPLVRHLREWPIGYDVAGEVVSVGTSQSCDVRVGDRVWGMSLGVAAEYAVVPCAMVVPIPAKLSFSEAAGLGVAGLTTVLGYQRAGLQPGQDVLVIGASGGCGQFGVTVGAAMGARVTGICSRRNLGFVGGLRPRPSAVVDYSNATDMARLVEGGEQFDVIYDTVTSKAPEDPNYEPQMRPLLRSGGSYLAIGPPPDEIDGLRGMADLVARPLGFGVQKSGYDWFFLLPTKALMLKLNGLFDAGKMSKVVIDSTYDVLGLEGAIAEAMARQQSRRATGKIILTFGA